MRTDTSLGFALSYTVRRMRRYSSEVLKRSSLDITVDQWAALKILDDQQGVASSALLSELMQKDRPTITRIVDILCRKGLTERKYDEKDRRKLNIFLTLAGKEKVINAYPVVEHIRATLEKGLSKSDFQHLDRILKMIISNTKQ